MQKNIFSFVCILFVSLSAATEVRIVSLNPAMTEILFELGLGKQIVGTTTFSNFPEDAKKIPVIGSYLSPRIEKIILLKPTHVLAFKEGDDAITAQLTRANLKLVVFDAKNLEDFPTLVEKISAEFGRENQAAKILQNWNSQITTLRKKSKNKSIMIQVDESPIFVAGGDTFLSQGLSLCGYQNVYSSVRGYARIQLESAIKKKPDFILFTNMAKNSKDVQKFWNSMPGLKDTPILLGDGDILSRLTPRFLRGIQRLCE